MGLIDQLRAFQLASQERTKRRWSNAMERRNKIKNGESVPSKFDEKRGARLEERTARMEEIRKKREEIRTLSSAPKTTRQRVIEYVSSGIAAGGGIVLVELNLWPATSIRNWGSFMDESFLGDFPVFFVVTFLIYIVLSPIRIYFLKRFMTQKKETSDNSDLLDQ